MRFNSVIGLEIHVELLTNTKIFCGCKNEFGAAPNTNCCPVCLGMPGALPVLNKKAVEYAIKAGLALNCEIAEFSKMDRKGYYYPDLPKAYQISQFDLPICKNGYVEIPSGDTNKKIRILRIHMEEDAGKLLHDLVPGATAVDLNRCGVPLIEIVTEPDMSSAAEAKEFLERLKAIIQFIGVSDCKMQEGRLRCDVNVSVNREGEPLGVRTEMKNLNSFSSIERAIQYELKRQIDTIESGEAIFQETLKWDDAKGMNYSMRDKEDSKDYRYFPDPDLVPIVVTKEEVENIRESLPELPETKKQRYICEFNLPEYDAALITKDKNLCDFFEEVNVLVGEPKKVSNWIMVDLLRLLKGMETDQLPVTPEQLAEAINLEIKGVVNLSVAKSVFEEVFKNGGSAGDIVKKKGLSQVNDDLSIRSVVQELIKVNEKSVNEFKLGNEKKVVTFFVGQVMKLMGGRANPKMVNEIVREELSK